MKHIQLFEEFINEIETGKVLFGEPKGSEWDPRFTDRWNALKIPFEPNTMDEKQLLDLLRAWITKEDRNPKLGALLKELLPLKKKFPVVLDPIKGRDVYDGTSFYRGTLIPIKDVLNLKGWFKNNSVDFDYGAIETNAPYTWTSITNKGFTSLTPAAEVADGFAADYMNKNGMKWADIINRLESGSGMIPVIIRIEDTHPNAIMNPKIMNEIGGLGEYEVLLVGTKTKVKSVIVPNWEFIEKAAKEIGADLTKYFKGI